MHAGFNNNEEDDDQRYGTSTVGDWLWGVSETAQDSRREGIGTANGVGSVSGGSFTLSACTNTDVNESCYPHFKRQITQYPLVPLFYDQF